MRQGVLHHRVGEPGAARYLSEEQPGTEMSRCRATAAAAPRASAAHRCVEPTTSVSRNVTTPPGSAARSTRPLTVTMMSPRSAGNIHRPVEESAGGPSEARGPGSNVDPAHQRDGNDSGPALNRTARLMAAGPAARCCAASPP